jgi:hypothetical protein
MRLPKGTQCLEDGGNAVSEVAAASNSHHRKGDKKTRLGSSVGLMKRVGEQPVFIPAAMGAMLDSSHVSRLSSLDLRGNKLSARCAEHITEVLKSPSQAITHLDLRHNRIGDEGLMALVEGLEDGMRCAVISLQLQSNMIGDEGAIALAGVFNKRRMGAKKTNRGELTAPNATVDPYLVRTITNCCPPLVCTWVLGSSPPERMRRSHTLTSIDLSENRISDLGGSELAYALAHNPTLTSISVRNNIMGAEGQASWQTLGTQIRQQNEHTSIPVLVAPGKRNGASSAARTAASIGAVRGAWKGFRYVRFVPVKLRQANQAEAVQTGRFWFWRHSKKRGSQELHPVGIKNPGGRCPRGSGPENTIRGTGIGPQDTFVPPVITKEILRNFYRKHEPNKDHTDDKLEVLLQHVESEQLEASMKAKYGEGPIELHELLAPRQGSGQWVDTEQATIIFDLGERNGGDDDDWGIDEEFSYRWSTALDKPECDPVRWVVEGAQVVSSSTKHWHMLDDRTLIDYPTPVGRREYVTGQGSQEIRFDWHEFYRLGKEAEAAAEAAQKDAARVKAHADWHARMNSDDENGTTGGGKGGKSKQTKRTKKTGGAGGGPIHGEKALTVGSFSSFSNLVGPFNSEDASSLEEALLEYPLPPCGLQLDYCCWEPQINYAKPKLHRDLSSLEMEAYWKEHSLVPHGNKLQAIKAQIKQGEDDVRHELESKGIQSALAAATAAAAVAPPPASKIDLIMHEAAPAAAKIVKAPPQVAMAMAVASATIVPDRTTAASGMFLASPAKGEWAINRLYRLVRLNRLSLYQVSAS